MLRLIQWLIFGHIHHWVVTEERNLAGESWEGESAIIGKTVYLQCGKCGTVRRRDLW